MLISSTANSSDDSFVVPPICVAIRWSNVVPARAPAPSAFAGDTWLSHVALGRACTPPSPSAGRALSPLNTTICSRNGSSGCNVGDSAKPLPSSAGVHCAMFAPFGM
jgi:hypothetical protein